MPVKRLMTLTLFLCAATFFSATAASGLDMNEGDWKVTMTTTMQGMPFQMPPQTYSMTQCVTKEDLAPRNSNKKDCVIKDQRLVGNTFYWKVVCDNKSSKTEGEGTITYSGASYTGNINARVTDMRGGTTMTILTKLSGRYVGPCSAATKAEAEKRKAQTGK